MNIGDRVAWNNGDGIHPGTVTRLNVDAKYPEVLELTLDIGQIVQAIPSQLRPL